MIEKLPSNIKKNRKALNISQKDLAQAIGMSPSIISGYESGMRTPPISELIKMSSLFNCSIDSLVGNQFIPPNTLDLSGLSVEQQQIVKQLVEVLKKK